MNESDSSTPDQYLSEAFVKSLHGRVSMLEGLLAENTDATNRTTEAVARLETNTADIVGMFRDLEGGFRVLQGLGRVMRVVGWFAAGATSVLALIAAIKGFWK